MTLVHKYRYHLIQIRVSGIRCNINLSADDCGSNVTAARITGNVFVVDPDQIQPHRANDHAAVFGRHATEPQRLGRDQVLRFAETTRYRIRSSVDHQPADLHAAERREFAVLE